MNLETFCEAIPLSNGWERCSFLRETFLSFFVRRFVTRRGLVDVLVAAASSRDALGAVKLLCVAVEGRLLVGNAVEGRAVGFPCFVEVRIAVVIRYRCGNTFVVWSRSSPCYSMWQLFPC